MVNKVNKDAFNRFKKLKPKNRMQLANSRVGQSMLALLTPSQFADLFPKQYRSGYLPDVGGFNLAISRKSQQKQQDILSGLATGQGRTLEEAEKAGRQQRQGSTGGGTGGTGATGTTTGGKISNPVMVKQIYDYLMTKPGMDHAHAIGIINNMSRESNFNSGALVTDSNGLPSGGLFQHNGPRFNKMTSYVGKDWQTNWKKQIDYALTEPEMQKYMKDKFGDESAASIGFTRTFEKPRNTESVAIDRAQSAKKYSDFVKSGGTSEQGTTPSQQQKGKYVSPVEGVFGRTSGNVFAADRSQGNRLHAGVDWTAKNGSDVVAPVSGKVLYSGHHSGYQNMIDILGDDGKIHRLAPHGSVGNFKVGDRIEQGQKVGIIDRAHLHYEIIPPSSSVFKEMSKGGSFVQTSWFPGQSPKTEDPAQALGIQPGTKVGVGGSLNVQQSQEERTKNSQEALGEIIKANPEHPFSKMIEKKMEMQGEVSLDKASPEKVGEKVDPEQLKVAPVPTAPTADVLKPTGPTPGTFDVNKDGFVKKVIELDGRAYFASERMIREGFNDDPRVKKAGVYIDENWKMHTKDTNNPDFKEAVKDFGGGILKPIEKRSEAETGQQTASLMDRVKKEFGGQAQAQEAGDAFAREAEYRKLHVYGPEMPTEKPKTGVDAVKMRQKIEGYYGRSINDHEYDMLIRATHGESSAKKHNPQEQAMIMGTILNRAKSHKGGIEGALMASRQFESVTGKTRGKFSPNPAYKAGPSERRMQSMFEATMQHLHNVPANQKYFTSEYGDKSGWHKKMVAMGGDVHAGTRFGTKLGQGPAPEVSAVAQATAPAPMPPPPVQDASLGQRIAKELAPVTPAQAATPPAPAPTPAPQAPEFPKATPQGVPTPPTRPTAFVTPPEPVKAPDESSTQNFLRSQGIPAQPVPGASDGGAFDLAISPLDKRDDHAVVNTKTQQPLFTVKSGERINVTPQQKVDGNMRPTGTDYGREMDALRQELSSSMASAGDPPKVQMKQMQQKRNDDPNFVEKLQKSIKNKPYNNPAFERAMNRTRMQETGDSLNGHFSAGNTNY